MVFKKGLVHTVPLDFGRIKSFQPRSWDQHVSGNRMREQSQPYAKMLGCWYHIDITKSIKFTYYVCISIYLSYIVFSESLGPVNEITTFPPFESIWLHQDLAEEGLVGVIGWGLSDEQMLPPFSPLVMVENYLKNERKVDVGTRGTVLFLP